MKKEALISFDGNDPDYDLMVAAAYRDGILGGPTKSYQLKIKKIRKFLRNADKCLKKEKPMEARLAIRKAWRHVKDWS